MLGLGLGAQALFGLPVGRQALGHPLALLGPLQDAGDPFHVSNLSIPKTQSNQIARFVTTNSGIMRG